ncbi:MAG: hypothetical protein UY50_C0018G0005 [Parcubacteria group bacterium GW2011_GWA2_49_9]|nr:MAG: hypothetical protein UY50_C0018G0005 [Parcubacteria group bacterium GW2011_GWA2_49_9]
MQNILSASVFNFLRNYGLDPGNPTHRRVVLFKGNPSWDARRFFGNDEWFYVTSEHQNFFRAVEELRKKLSEKRLASVWRDDQIKGIDYDVETTIVWPITATFELHSFGTPTKGPANARELDEESGPYANQGLALAPVWRNERWQAFLYTLLPSIPTEEIPDHAYLDTYKHPNLFEAAARLEAIVKQRETERGVRLAGIHDRSPCWPKGL